MSKWLTRSRELRSARGERVPNVPKSPKLPCETYFGDFGTFGTAAHGAPEGEAPVSVQAATGPDEWTAGVGSLVISRAPCPGFSAGRWGAAYDRCCDFLTYHAEEARRLGWTTLDLFGVHPELGVVRVDLCGALMMGGAKVAAVQPDCIRYANGLAFRRATFSSVLVPVWRSLPHGPYGRLLWSPLSRAQA